ncbi:TOBE [hydrothermal vent metagenome]|uniref:TOBE n=1 Tax=hydrothermal vent metagenome TaxID=652676 RepID=A0A1W1B8W4_9ZZZZ
MNLAQATITHIESTDSVNIVDFKISNQHMQMVSLELKGSLTIGTQVTIACKSTNIAIANSKSTSHTIPNQIEIEILQIKDGKLLSSIIFDFEGNRWEAVVTRESFAKLNLLEGDRAIAMLNVSELSIVERA